MYLLSKLNPNKILLLELSQQPQLVVVIRSPTGLQPAVNQQTITSPVNATRSRISTINPHRSKKKRKYKPFPILL